MILYISTQGKTGNHNRQRECSKQTLNEIPEKVIFILHQLELSKHLEVNMGKLFFQSRYDASIQFFLWKKILSWEKMDVPPLCLHPLYIPTILPPFMAPT